MDKIAPCLWFDRRAEEAARFCVSVQKLDMVAMQAAFEGERV